ncbi:MAG: 3-deoxy-manno-octulosonate cytidylyltransferase [Phycisphaerales bacterium]|nr:3-deoxy-manno-octulosonate cytidylyltransferase [Phycisphaerales bacterium]
MIVIAIIPARYASTRFPGKPLANQTGKPLIRHVYEAVARAGRVSRVVVATDDRQIAEAVDSFGGQVVMTSSDHATGTDRVAEAARGLNADLIINVQGDEPEMNPDNVDRLIELMEARPQAVMGTLACPFGNEDDLRDPACVKVVLDQAGYALYFSRSLIPYPRDTSGRADDPGRWLLHLGIYAYRPGFLAQLTQFPPTELEQIEQLEQLRVLYLGEKIAVAVVQHRTTGIDTPEQYAAFVKRYQAGQAVQT